MNTDTNVINATVGRPVLWNGDLDEPDTKVLSVMRKRTLPAAPSTVQMTAF